MNYSTSLPAITTLKKQAKRMREKLRDDGQPISHSQSLEIIARQLGYKDWNTLFASAGNRQSECPLVVGQRVQGQYLGQNFEGQLIGLVKLQTGNRFRVTLQFDEPVDVVTFDSFSAYRQRVSATVNVDGISPEKTGNGNPQLRLHI